MQIVRCIALGVLVAFASCHLTQKAVATVPPTQQQEKAASQIVNMLQQKPVVEIADQQKNNHVTQPALLAFNSDNLPENKENTSIQPQSKTETNSNDFATMSSSFENKQSENIQSFAQVKQMVADKQINLSKKQLKRIDKLDNKYHGDLNKFKDDASGLFDTQTSKIIAAVGVVGLLLLIVSSSGFGAFLLILSVGALLLKWLHIISF